MKIDEIVETIITVGSGALMAKLYIRSAYRNVPIHPEDWILLGMQWRDLIYVDTVLPFGLRSAPKIFTALVDGLEWIIQKRGVRYLFSSLPGWLYHHRRSQITGMFPEPRYNDLDMQRSWLPIRTRQSGRTHDVSDFYRLRTGYSSSPDSSATGKT